MAQTQSAWTPTKADTATPRPTSTKKPQLPTTDPEDIYLLDAGICPSPDTTSNQVGNACISGQQENVTLKNYTESVTVTVKGMGGFYINCTLYNYRGEMVSFHIAGKSTETKITCAPNDLTTPTIAPTVVPATQTFVAEEELRAPKGNGFYLVGIDIAPGIWRSTGQGEGCYWSVTTKTGDIIDNHFGMAGGTAYVPANGFQVEFQDCGIWEYLGQ